MKIKFYPASKVNVHGTSILSSSSTNRISHWACSIRKDVLRNSAKFTGKHLCPSLFFDIFIKKETLAQVFSCEFCEISKNTFFTEHLWVIASILSFLSLLSLKFHRKHNYRDRYLEPCQTSLMRPF